MKTVIKWYINPISLMLMAIIVLGFHPKAYAVSKDDKPCSVCLVDMRRLVEESAKGKAIKEKLKKEASRAESSLAGLKSKLDSLQKEVANQSALLSEAAQKKKRDQIDDLQREFADSLRDAQENIAIKEREGMKEFIKIVDIALVKWAKTHPGAVVLEKDPSFVVYAKDYLDVTDSIKELIGK